MSAFPPSAAMVSAANSRLLAPSGNSSISLRAALIQETGRVFRVSAIDNPMLSYMTTAVKRRPEQNGGNLEEARSLRLLAGDVGGLLLSVGARNGSRSMKRTTVNGLHRKWMKNPTYRCEYEALAGEYSLAAALIEARARAGLTQEQVARRMKTTQAVVARLEGGGSMPSTRTLEKFARATDTRLKISFESEKARG